MVTVFRFVEFVLGEDAAAAIDNMHQSEIFGRTIHVNFSRPPKASEVSSRPVWADNEWLKKYGGGGGTAAETTAEGGGEGDTEMVDGVAKPSTGPSKELTKVYMGIKIGQR